MKVGTILIWFIIAKSFSLWLDCIRLGRKSSTEKDLEILILRHQLAILERKYHKIVHPSRGEKLILAILINQLKQKVGYTIHDLRNVVHIVRPETVLKWHRELVKRKWTFRRQKQGGRPQIDPVVETLILRLARENDWGMARLLASYKNLDILSVSRQLPIF